jgi:hypothetical protein
MGNPVYYGGCLEVRPPLSKQHASIVEDVLNRRDSEQAKRVFAAIRTSEEPDLPYYGGQMYVTEDGANIQVDEDEQRHGLRLWLVHLLKHFFAPLGYTVNGEIGWSAPDDIEDRGSIYVKDNSIEAIDLVLFDAGPSWEPNHFADQGLKDAILNLLASADNTGCTSDLTVVSSEALSHVRELLAKVS